MKALAFLEKHVQCLICPVVSSSVRACESFFDRVIDMDGLRVAVCKDIYGNLAVCIDLNTEPKLDCIPIITPLAADARLLMDAKEIPGGWHCKAVNEDNDCAASN